MQEKMFIKKIKTDYFRKKNLDKVPTRESTPEPTKHKKSKLKLQQEFMNRLIAKEKHLIDETFWNHFK